MNVKKRLGELLLEAGVVSEAQVQTALAHQRKWGGKLGQALVELKLATEPQIVAALSRKLGYEIVDVAALAWSTGLQEALDVVPAEVALRHTLLPIACDASSVTIAMSDPSNIAVVDELAFRTGRRIRIAVAGDRAIAAAVQRFYFSGQPQRDPVARPSAPRDPAVLQALQRAARGDGGALESGQLAAALARALLRKGILTEAELANELSKPVS